MSKIGKTISGRTSALIIEAQKRLVLPDMASRVCNNLMAMTNSLIASRFIGISAVSAITLVAPIILLDTCLHNLLVSGTSSVLIRYKSRGNNAEANQAFGAILSNAFFWYVLFYILVLLFSENIFHLFSHDEALVADAIEYLIPFAILEPFNEAGLCLERGFKTDGRNGFFGIRGILTGILTLVFDFLVVLVFKGGLMELSLASSGASFLGYCWSCTHLFSSRCTIRPDFSVLRDRAAFRKYLKEEIQIGHVYALDDGLCAGASSLMNKAYIVTGGTAGLAAVGICGAINNVIISINGTMDSSTFSLCNLFYSTKDYRGTVITLRISAAATLIFSSVVWIVLNLFPEAIGTLYRVDSPDVMEALYPCLRFGTAVAVTECFLGLYSSFMLSTGRPGSARGFAVARNLVMALSAVIGLTGIGFSVLMAIYMILSLLLTIVARIYLYRSTRNYYKAKDQDIRSHSYMIDADGCPDIGQAVWDLCQDIPILQPLSSKASLLTEEFNRLVQHVNQDNPDPVNVDFRVLKEDDGCVITIVDTGKPFDPINQMRESELPEDLAAARKILLSLSPKARYSRLLGLNVSHLFVPFSMVPSLGSGRKSRFFRRRKNKQTAGISSPENAGKQ